VNWRYLPASNEIIWSSERSGWSHLYLYDLATGKLKNQITSGDWAVTQLLRVDEKTRTLYFLADGREKANPYFTQLYRIGFDGKGQALLTPEDANHDVSLSPSGRFFVDSSSTPDVPRVTVVRDEAGKPVSYTHLDVYKRQILHNNVGIGTGDDGILSLSEQSWDKIMSVNLKGMFLSCRSVLPVMREQRSGSIINISSIAAVCSTNILAYKTSKAGVNALTHQIAMENAKYNIRANVIMPGLMNTPMAIEGISKSRGIPKAELIAKREALVPLGQKMGTAWDVAFAALFLASDEAKFITGVMLPVDGGQSARIG